MSNTSLEINEAVNIIINKPTPLLFVDTCILLDIIRLPFRQKKSTTANAYLESSEQAVKLMKNNKLKVIILPLILKEFSDNLKDTKNELSRHIENIFLNLDILLSLHQLNLDEFKIFNLKSLKTESMLEQICNDLIKLGIHIKENDNLILKANNRMVRNIPPSRKGSVKDCIIYEHCLEIVSQLRKQGVVEKVIFVTSNTKDFCDNNGIAKKPICDELIKHEIELCTNWSWAINEILKTKQ